MNIIELSNYGVQLSTFEPFGDYWEREIIKRSRRVETSEVEENDTDESESQSESVHIYVDQIKDVCSQKQQW